MRFYNRPHTHYCGIDLHVKTMYVCILDGVGQVVGGPRLALGRGEVPAGAVVGASIVQDVAPYILVDGNPAKARGLNLLGLQRHGFSEEEIRARINQGLCIIGGDAANRDRREATRRRGRRGILHRLKAYGLTSFCKTSGGKGLHVCAPLTPKLGWDEVKDGNASRASALWVSGPDQKLKRIGKTEVLNGPYAETRECYDAMGFAPLPAPRMSRMTPPSPVFAPA